jgi:hypothetical protein
VRNQRLLEMHLDQWPDDDYACAKLAATVTLVV